MFTGNGCACGGRGLAGRDALGWREKSLHWMVVTDSLLRGSREKI